MNIKNWVQPTGYNNTKFSSVDNGLPKNKPLWLKAFETCGTLNPIVSYEDSIYFIVSKPNCIFNILCIDSNNGNCNWTSSDIFSKSLTSDLFVTDTVICAWDTIISRENGKVLFDCRKFFPETEFSNGTFIVLGDRAVRPVHFVNKPNEFLVVDLNTFHYEIKNYPIKGGKAVNSIGGIVGWNTDSNPYLSSVLPDGSELWKSEPIDVGQFFHCGENTIVTISSNKIRVLSVLSGEVVTESTKIKDIEFLDETSFRYARYVVAHDRLYITYGKNIACIDFIESNITWTKDEINIQDFCGFGDLIIFIENKWDLVAYDRYSGNEIWRFSERYMWQSLSVSKNKIIIYCTTGEIACFECGEPYISPNRPK